mgnify:CR=1 FL=1
MGYPTLAYAIKKGYGRDIISHRLVARFISWNCFFNKPCILFISLNDLIGNDVDLNNEPFSVYIPFDEEIKVYSVLN